MPNHKQDGQNAVVKFNSKAWGNDASDLQRLGVVFKQTSIIPTTTNTQ